ncbi:PI-PLC domain-containing protein [Actinomadura macrotermitis]|uniref:hypothetical protein n=1 Tax=Actinomadura macrotermitis TaxID=2585200 RepID=UPI001295E387|nr:hypothetical protein [Actinomadura macrotermitis]
MILLLGGVMGAVLTGGVGEKVAAACESAICRVAGGDCRTMGLGEHGKGGARQGVADHDGGKAQVRPLVSVPQQDLPPISRPACPDPKVPWVDTLHAHNDYQNGDPLDDALEEGATSVEADVWLEDGKLILKHDKDDLNLPNATLLQEYLRPLTERAAKNGGQIYPGRGEKFELFIEVKGGGGDAYEQIVKDIAGPPPLTGDVRVVLPVPPNYDPATNKVGNTSLPANVSFSVGLGDKCVIPTWLDPKDPANDPRSPEYRPDEQHYDQRLASKVTVLNGEFAKCVDVDKKRKLNISPQEHRVFNELVGRAHSQGRKVRIWGAPDGNWRYAGSRGRGKFYPCPTLPGHQKCEGALQRNWWQAVDEAGADYYVTDHLGTGAKWIRKNCGRFVKR